MTGGMQPSAWSAAQIVNQSHGRPVSRRIRPRPGWVAPPSRLACHGGRSAASPPTRSMSRSRNVGDVRLDGDVQVGPRPVSCRGSATVIPVVSSPRVSTSTNSASVATSDRSSAAATASGIVDERAVEPVVAGVELEVEAQRVGDVADDRVARHRAGRLHRVLAAASAIESSGVLPARRASRTTWSGVIRARSVTSRPSASGAGSPGRARIASAQAANTILAASGSQWTFHSVVGVVLPDTPNAPPIST